MARFSDPLEPSPPSMTQNTVTTEQGSYDRVQPDIRMAEIALENRRLDELKEKRENESIFRSGWRPALGWMYIGICIFDFSELDTAIPTIQTPGKFNPRAFVMENLSAGVCMDRILAWMSTTTV